MATATVSFSVNINEDATEKQVKEWIKHHLYGGGMSLENPLVDLDMEVKQDEVTINY